MIDMLFFIGLTHRALIKDTRCKDGPEKGQTMYKILGLLLLNLLFFDIQAPLQDTAKKPTLISCLHITDTGYYPSLLPRELQEELSHYFIGIIKDSTIKKCVPSALSNNTRNSLKEEFVYESSEAVCKRMKEFLGNACVKIELLEVITTILTENLKMTKVEVLLELGITTALDWLAQLIKTDEEIQEEAKLLYIALDPRNKHSHQAAKCINKALILKKFGVTVPAHRDWLVLFS